MNIQNILNLELTSIAGLLNEKVNCLTGSGKQVLEVASRVHHNIIDNLIYSYIDAKKTNNSELLTQKLLCRTHQDKLKKISIDNTENIPNICEQLHINYLNSSYSIKNGILCKVKSKQNLIENGAVYTQSHIAYDIVKQTINNWVSNNGQCFDDFKILDFACGTGRFYNHIVSVLNKFGITNEDAVLKHCFAVDIDPVAVNITRLFALTNVKEINEENINIIVQHIVNKNALTETDIFNTANTFKCFDCIVSNPPYLVLKSDKRKMDTAMSKKIKSQADYFKHCGMYNHSVEGMLNLYKLSIEQILCLTKTNGETGIICPSTLFADKSATKLRKHLLQKHKLKKIKYYTENDRIFENVSQATAIFFLQKNSHTQDIEIESKNSIFSVSIDQIKNLFGNSFEIPTISDTEWQILNKINKFNKLKNISNVRNKRGELDLTAYKQYITKTKTKYRLVRGNMLSSNKISDINNEYVLDT
ncbi:MAG: Eco57I restriction-modification methylase domain-containing protein, partial [Bacteroidales bacterium]|nr:Eco57I restriction-modification methylase domain-containing protein [Bacteroidales bacterium]